jgi:flagellar hook-associated protein 2
MTTTAATAAPAAPAASTTTPVSIASSSSSGAAGGSVINVSSLVSQLVAATEGPQQTQIANQTAAVTANISALGTLKSALSTFQQSLTPLSTPSSFNSESASSSDQTTLTATADAGAVNGNYAVTISNLASAQQLLSAPVIGGSAATVGTGTLSLSLGGTAFNVVIDSSNDSLSGIAAAINAASDNPGIGAAVIQGTDGAHLLLSSTQTGATSTITVTESDGGNGLAALTYGPGNLANYTQEAAAQDASFSVAGVPFTSASNSVSDALSGVTLDLLAPTASGSTATLTVASDTSTVTTNVQAFVDAYNTLHTALAGLGSFDPTTGTAGPLLGNTVLTGAQNQIQQVLYSFVGSSNYNSLASIGVTTNADGSLSLNSSRLQTALASNFSAVSQLFSGSNGVASQLNSRITTELGATGPVTSYGQSLTAQENALTAQSDTLSTQMTALTATLTQQYAALNTLLSSLQSTSAYLTQAFASLPTVQGIPNA